MLKRLELNCFKKHEHTVVEFTPGLNGIFGNNYKGKTTLLNGVMYCLGGASAVPGKNLMTRGKSAGFQQSLVFECAGEDYFVVRTKSKAEIYKGQDDTGELLATGTTPVNALIEKLLGMPLKLFKQLRYGEQKKTDAILTLGPSKLHEILEQLTGIDDVNVAITRLGEILKTEATNMEAYKYVDPEPLHKEMEANRKMEASAGEMASVLEDKMANLKNQLKVSQDELVEIRGRKKKFAEVNKRITEIGQKVELLEQQLQDLEGKRDQINDTVTDQALAEMADKVMSLQEQQGSLKDAIRDVKNAEPDIQRFEGEVRKLKASLEKLKEILDSAPTISYEDQIAALDNALDSAKGDLAVVMSEIKRIEALGGADVCPSCGQEICKEAGGAFDLAAAEARRDDLRESVRELNEKRKSLQEALEELDRARQQTATKLQSLEAAEVELEKLASSRDAGQKLIDSSPSLADLEAELKSARDIYDQAKAERLLAENLQPDIERTESEIKQLLEERTSIILPKYSEERENELQAEVDQLNPELHEVTNKWTEAAQQASAAKVAVENLEEKLQSIEHSNSMYKQAEAKHVAAKALQKYLRDNRDRYMTGMWSTFMASASEFAISCTSGGIERMARSEEGSFIYFEEGHEMDIKEASGAQRSVMGLAVQVALSESYECPLDILMIDEPAADMDSEHSMSTSMMLSSKGKQVIMISHSQMDNSVCENVITL